MALKNKYSTSTRVFDDITKTLIAHKAKQIVNEYSDDGRLTGVKFALEIHGQLRGFALPARYENVGYILFKNKWSYLSETQRQRAYQTAWANIRDWISAQMAMVDTEMVKLEEVFLPYMLDNTGKTYFENLENRGFLLPPGGSE